MRFLGTKSLKWGPPLEEDIDIAEMTARKHGKWESGLLEVDTTYSKAMSAPHSITTGSLTELNGALASVKFLHKTRPDSNVATSASAEFQAAMLMGSDFYAKGFGGAFMKLISDGDTDSKAGFSNFYGPVGDGICGNHQIKCLGKLAEKATGHPQRRKIAICLKIAL